MLDQSRASYPNHASSRVRYSAQHKKHVATTKTKRLNERSPTGRKQAPPTTIRALQTSHLTPTTRKARKRPSRRSSPSRSVSSLVPQKNRLLVHLVSGREAM